MTIAIDVPRSGRVVALLARIDRKVWALMDQVLISATNFITMMLALRGMGQSAFGAFTLVYTAMLFANMLQSALITQPHNVLAASRRGKDYVRYTTSVGMGQVKIAIGGAALALVAWAISAGAGWSAAGLLLALAPAIFGWQIQEFVRRVMYTEGRYAAALVNDIISYGGQAIVIAALWKAEKLTGPIALHAIAITSLLAAVLGVWQIRASIGSERDPGAMQQNWNFGKWLAGAEVLGWLSSIHIYLYLAALLLGTAATGELKGAQILFGPTRILSFCLGTVLPIRFARSLASGGKSALGKQVAGAFGLVVPVLGAYCLVVAICAKPLLKLVYGDSYTGGASVLVLFSAVAFLSYLQMIFTAALTAKRNTHHVFYGSLVGGLIALAMSIPLIHFYGSSGAVVAMIVGGTLGMIYSAIAYRRDAGVAVEDEPSTEETKDSSPENSPRLLVGVLETFKNANVEYCMLHGYQEYPHRVPSDVDCMMPAKILPKPLAQLLHREREHIGGRIVQWLDDGAHFVVLANDSHDGQPELLQLHVSKEFELRDRLYYSANEVLGSRRKYGTFFVPNLRVEFGCVLTNRISKGNLKDSHTRQLSELYAADPQGAREEANKFFSPASAEMIIEAAEADQWESVHDNISELQNELLTSTAKKQPMQIVLRRLATLARRVKRLLKPNTGIHVVFLGPDGVGKSTVIDAVRDNLRPAFMRTDYFTFAPSLLPAKYQAKPSPHAKPPRSLPASLLKAGWWSICYTIGYFCSIHPARARSSLVLNHRYLLDAIVDPKRYRYSGPLWILRAIWKISPKPDLVILLDAPPEIVWARKKEVTLAETTRQRDGYRRLIKDLKNGHIVDASQPLEKTIADAQRIILRAMSDRIERRFRLERAS